MTEYINKQDALKIMRDAWDIYEDGDIAISEAIKCVESLPTTDVVEVVRCKNCIYYKTPHCAMDIWRTDVKLYRAKENDYCSYGRKG